MRVRQSARVVLLNQQNRVLLFQYEDTINPFGTGPKLMKFWVTPGGGVEPGETFEQTARRELLEETGLKDIELGPWIWQLEKEIELLGEPVLIHERQYLAWLYNGTVNTDNLLEHEQKFYRSYHWWSLEELRTSQEVILPLNFAVLVEPLMNSQIPTVPLRLKA